MTLYIDIDNKKLVQSLTSDRTVATPVFMQGDNEPLELHLLEKGTENLYAEKALVVGTDFLRVAIARFKGYPKSLTYASGYTLNPNGGAEVILPLNTTAIENAVQDNEYISAFLEVEYSNTSGKIVTVLQTTCRVKNDLIDNAPSVDLQDQFYDKVYTDEIFSKKSANLSDLADKGTSRTNLEVYSKEESDAQEALNLKKASNLSDLANKPTARTNLDVYGKSETYKKSEIDAQEALNLKKASNLSDVANKATSRTNLDVYSKAETDAKYPAKASNLSDMADIPACRNNLNVPHKNDLTQFGYMGIYSDSSLTNAFDSYTSIVAGGDTFTMLSTYLPITPYFNLIETPYTESGMYFQISDTKVDYGYIYNYDYENNVDNSRACSFPISKPFEFGDRIALVMENRVMRLYKNMELVGQGTLDEALCFYGFTGILVYKGLKKNFAYFPNTVLPLTSTEGKNWMYNYSIEDWVNNVPVPSSLNNGLFTLIKYSFPTASYGNISGCTATGGVSFSGVTNAMKVSASVGKIFNRYIQIQKYGEPSVQYYGRYKLKFKIYIPSTNPSLKRVQIRIGNYALSNFQMTNRINLDASGYVTAHDAWTDVEVEFKAKAINSRMSGYVNLYAYGTTNTTYEVTTADSDVFYITGFYLYGFEGCELNFMGNSKGGLWRNLGKADVSLSCDGAISFPNDIVEPFIRTYEITSFNSGYYEYFNNSVSGYDLSQIILLFDSQLDSAPEGVDPNKFRLSINGGYECCSELLPVIPENTAYNIYPKFGIRDRYISEISIDPIYSCSGKGKIILIFNKTAK